MISVLLLLSFLQSSFGQTITGINIPGVGEAPTTLMQGNKGSFNQIARMGGNTTVQITGTNFPIGMSVTAWYGREYSVPYPSGNVIAGSTGYIATCESPITSATTIICTAACVQMTPSSIWEASGGYRDGAVSGMNPSCRLPGVGANHEWKLTFIPDTGASTTISSLPITTSFFPAMVAGSSFGVLKGSDFDNEKWMNTKGEPQGDPAQKMIFYNVQNRGLAKDPNNVIYALYEGPDTSILGIAGKPLFASCEIDDGSTEKTVEGKKTARTILCTPSAGVGVGHYWTLFVGGQVAKGSLVDARSPTSAAYRYGPTYYRSPAISAIYVSHSTLATIGGDTVVITGTNFGPVDIQNVVHATYENTALSSLARGPFTASSCSVTVAHTQITCTSVPGVGREHVWTVNVGGQTGSGTPTTSYTLPMIRSILPKIATFSGISTGGFGHSTCTTGYDSYSPCMVKLSGTNFGPALVSNPITAAYNNGIYTATDCEVIVADTVIECRSVEKKIGSSIGHTWVVTVGSQSSLASVATTRYAAPQITSISTNAGGGLSGLSTDGRDRITMTGTNFGKMGSVVTASYLNSKLKNLAGTKFMADCSASDGNGVTFDHTSVTCKTGPGIGHHQTWQVTLDGDRAGERTSGVVTGQYTSYVYPTVLRVSIDSKNECGKNCSTSGSDLITLRVSNAGPVTPNNIITANYKTFGSMGFVGSYNVTCTYIGSSMKVICPTAPGIGGDWLWRVNVGDQWSFVNVNQNIHAGSNAYARPTINRITMPLVSASPVVLSYQGGELIVIEGTNFGPIGSTEHARSASYSSDGGRKNLTATGCAVTVADTKMVCTSAPLVVATRDIFLWHVEVGGSLSLVCANKQCETKYVAQWHRASATGCATSCGVADGMSGTDGTVSCVTGSDSMCDAETKPVARTCPATAACVDNHPSPSSNSPSASSGDNSNDDSDNTVKPTKEIVTFTQTLTFSGVTAAQIDEQGKKDIETSLAQVLFCHNYECKPTNIQRSYVKIISISDVDSHRLRRLLESEINIVYKVSVPGGNEDVLVKDIESKMTAVATGKAPSVIAIIRNEVADVSGVDLSEVTAKASLPVKKVEETGNSKTSTTAPSSSSTDDVAPSKFPLPLLLGLISVLVVIICLASIFYYVKYKKKKTSNSNGLEMSRVGNKNRPVVAFMTPNAMRTT